MARPARRRPTLPDHDPRAIRGALRREIYELGDSLRFLDDIEFRVGEVSPSCFDEPSGPALELTINGERMSLERDWDTVPASMQWVPTASLRDHDGRRRVCIGSCGCDAMGCRLQFAAPRFLGTRSGLQGSDLLSELVDQGLSPPAPFTLHDRPAWAPLQLSVMMPVNDAA